MTPLAALKQHTRTGWRMPGVSPPPDVFFRLDPFHAEVARVALRAARGHGFALAGSCALAAHGLISRPAGDVDLFTDCAFGVETAAAHVVGALSAAGFDCAPTPWAEEMSEFFEDFAEGMAEYQVSRGRSTVELQLVMFGRGRAPVQTEVGPVLRLADLLAGKVAALAARAAVCDYIDVAAALRVFPRARLLALGRRAEPSLRDEEFAAAMDRLDWLGDRVFTGSRYAVTPHQVGAIRQAFALWPRSV